MRIRHAAASFMICLWCMGGCRKEEVLPAANEPSVKEKAPPKVTMHAPEPSHSPLVLGPRAPELETEPNSELTQERVWGRADLDPENDDVVAPPDAVPDCHARLETAGVKFRPARLPLKQIVREIPTCGCEDAVTVTQAPHGMKLAPPAVLSCQMALAIVGLERVIQEHAVQHLGERVRTLHQGGTYSCRKMARFDLVSEHSYGNAIDVYAFSLESGEKVSVLLDFGRLNQPSESLSPRAMFLRRLSSTAYDRDLVSVSLSPYWDTLHRDHFHFDMARYRVDGSRQR